MEPAQIYPGLMKQTLSYALWEEPCCPIEMLYCRMPAILHPLAKLTAGILRTANFRLVRCREYTNPQRESVAILPSHADTMIGAKRLDNLQACIKSAL